MNKKEKEEYNIYSYKDDYIIVEDHMGRYNYYFKHNNYYQDDYVKIGIDPYGKFGSYDQWKPVSDEPSVLIEIGNDKKSA